MTLHQILGHFRQVNKRKMREMRMKALMDFNVQASIATAKTEGFTDFLETLKFDED